MKSDRDIVVVGVLGEVECQALEDMFSDLPIDFPASILVVFQIPSDVLKAEQILIRNVLLPFVWAHEGQRIRRSCIYLGSPYANLIVRSWGVLGLEPAMANDTHHSGINRLFDSAVHVWGNRIIGMLLNSERASQVRSLASIKAAGGIAVLIDKEKNFSLSFGEAEERNEKACMSISYDISKLLGNLVLLPIAKFAGKLSFKMRIKKIYKC